MRRRRAKKRYDKKMFSKTASASGVHKKNYASAPMRGGWRI